MPIVTLLLSWGCFSSPPTPFPILTCLLILSVPAPCSLSPPLETCVQLCSTGFGEIMCCLSYCVWLVSFKLVFIPFTLVQTTGFCFCGYVVFHCIYTMFSFLIHCDWKYLWMTEMNDSSLTLGLLHRRVVRFWFHAPSMWACWLSPSQGQAGTVGLCECSCI